LIKANICVSIVEADVRGMASAATAAWLEGADLVELRLDCLAALDAEKVDLLLGGVEQIGVPKVVTVMPSRIFGRYSGSDRERAGLLAGAADRADYIDINREMNPEVFGECLDRIAGGGAKPVVSWHSGRMIEQGELRDFVSSVRAAAGPVFKAVMPASRIEDNLAALEMCRSLSGHRRVVFCHGNMGRVSRVLAPLFGSEWTYASLKRGREAAPGQIDLQSMRQAQEALAG